MTRPVQGANVLFKAMEVLDAIAEASTPPRLADLARITGLPVGTLHRIVDALTAGGFVRRDDGARTYLLGPRLLQLARRAWDAFDIRGAAAPELQRVHEAYGETVVLGVMVDAAVVIIDKIEGSSALRTSPSVGQRVPLHCTAVGKAILSALEPAEQARTVAALTLETYTPTTVQDRSTLRAHLAMMGARRYAIEDEEHAAGVRGVAAAVLNQRGSPIGAISISGSSKSLSFERLLEIGAELAEAALRISWNLGFTPPEPWPDFAIVARGADPVSNAVPASAFLGASPVWSAHDQRLHWVDIMRHAIHRSVPAGGADEMIPLPDSPGNIVPTEGGLLVALRSGIVRMDAASGELMPVLSLFDRESHQRYNSAKCDAQGRLWITVMDVTVSRANGRLYRVDGDLKATPMAEGLLVPIGIGWSPDGRRLYFCDAPRREIYEYEFDPDTGDIANQRLFARVAEGAGRPTGLAIDRAGHVWSLQTDGWCITRYDPDGHIERVVTLPVPKPIDCCFGGPEMRTLYITTARLGLFERRLAEVPWSGSVLAYECPEPGLPSHAFRGPWL